MNQSIKDNPIRSLLVVTITAFVMCFVSYIAIVNGEDKGTLNLLIGFVIGLMSGVMGVYFNSSNKPSTPVNGGETTAEINATISKKDD